MGLRSELFNGDKKLEACLLHDSAHLTEGVSGSHVAKVQIALFAVDGLPIDRRELRAKFYGPSTASAVLSYKTRRKIINRRYQSSPDNIVGKMIIAALDKDMVGKEATVKPFSLVYCGNDPSSTNKNVPSLVPQASPLERRIGSSGTSNFTPVSANASIAQMALTRVPTAIVWIRNTRLRLGRLIQFRVNSLPIPPFILRDFDKVWRHFSIPKDLPIQFSGIFPDINNLEEFLTTIDRTYEQMLKNLAEAKTVFHDQPFDVANENDFAFTLGDDRRGEDPRTKGWLNGIYFTKNFAGSGPLKQTEVVVHETSHYPRTEVYQDNFKPSSKNYGKDARLSLENAWSYSMFVLDVLFDRLTPFDVDT